MFDSPPRDFLENCALPAPYLVISLTSSIKIEYIVFFYLQTMASKNSINKPKATMRKKAHAALLARKRLARAKLAEPTRSSHGRYNLKTAPRPSESKAVALYAGGSSTIPGKVITTSVLSKKRARKIERNARYIAKRNLQLDADLASQGGMDVDVDVEIIGKVQKCVKPGTKLEKVKKALWAAVEHSASEKLALPVTSEGTTIGIQAF